VGVLNRRWWAWLAVAALAFVTCVGLAWWQWDRYSQDTHSLQNLGYTLLWPLIGLFGFFMWWRSLRLEMAARQAPAEEEQRPAPAPAPVRPKPKPVELVDGDQDDELAAYNRYLRRLNEQDRV
jgi:DNA-binding transcriptional regulator of glucitol operon